MPFYLLKITNAFIFLLFISLQANEQKKVTFSKSMEIVLNTSFIDMKEDYTNFPVLLKLNKDNIGSNIFEKKISGRIRLATPDSSFLPYKVQTMDIDNKTAQIWIILPKLYGDESTQYVTLLWDKNKDLIEKDKEKERVNAKESHERTISDSVAADSSIFKSSYNAYGVWSSNEEGGFSAIFDINGDSE